MNKKITIFSLLFLILAVFISCDTAEEKQYNEITGNNVVLRGTWNSQPVSFTDSFGESYNNTIIVLSFTDNELTIKKGTYISQAYPYARNGIVVNITDPEYADTGFDFSVPVGLEFSGQGFSAYFSDAVEFLKGAPKMTFTKISEEPSLTPSVDSPQVRHNMVLHLAEPAECEKDGNIQYYECMECGKYFSDEAGKNELTKEDIIIEAAGHEYSGTPVIVKESTDCTVTGIRMFGCIKCGRQIVENYTAPHEMKYVSETTADCENNGYDEHYECEVCNKFFLDEDGKEETSLIAIRNSVKTGHDFSKRVPYTATVNSYGIYMHSVVCSRCDKYEKLEKHVSNDDGSHCALCGKTATYTYDLSFTKEDNSIDYTRVAGLKSGSTVKNVIIPDEYPPYGDVGYINENAFANTDIETIYISDTTPYGLMSLVVGSNVFDGCDNLTDVYIGDDARFMGSEGIWEPDWLGDAADHVTVHTNVSLSDYKKLYF